MELVTRSGQDVARLALAAHPETPGECVAVALDAFLVLYVAPGQFETRWP